MSTITATCAKCHAPMTVELDFPPDPELWPKLCLLLLCKACQPKREPPAKRPAPRREIRQPYRDD